MVFSLLDLSYLVYFIWHYVSFVIYVPVLCIDYDADVIFEDDEEEEAYFFAGQGTTLNNLNIISPCAIFQRVTRQHFGRIRRGRK